MCARTRSVRRHLVGVLNEDLLEELLGSLSVTLNVEQLAEVDPSVLPHAGVDSGINRENRELLHGEPVSVGLVVQDRFF